MADADEFGTLQVNLALRRVSFDWEVNLLLPGRGVTALFGASGAGKTTLLRAVAGLEPTARGRLAVLGDCWQDSARRHFIPTHRRAVGYVAQEAALFPHLSVLGNLGYGWRRSDRRRRVSLDETLTLLDLDPLLHRRVSGLSGGERQRVAIARALLTAPRILLLDEPLSALDISRKAELLPYLERLTRRLALPTLYVSHDPEEVLRLADHLVLFDNGRVRLSGDVDALMRRPDLDPLWMPHLGVRIEASVLSHDEHDHLTAAACCAGARIWVPRRPEPAGTPLRLRIAARDVSLALSAPSGTSILNALPATVVALADTTAAGQRLVELDSGGVRLLSLITARSASSLRVSPGQHLWALVKSVAVH